MADPKIDIADALKVVQATDDVSRTIRLLTWARNAGYRIGPVLEVGTVKMQIQDIRQAKGDLHTAITASEPDVMAEYGATDMPVEGTEG